MVYHIPGVLSPQDVAYFHGQPEQAEWMDRRVITGTQGAQARNSQQVNTHSTLYTVLQNEVLNAVNQHALLSTATSSRILSTLLSNRYQNNGTYGFHADGTVHSHSQNGWTRTDLSAALLLSDPQSYDGSELIVNDTFRQHRVKPPADGLMLYPSSSLHCMTPVARGIRVTSFTWVRSMIRDNKKCAMLFELDNGIQSLKSRYGESEEILSLLSLYHSPLREWSEI